MALVAQAGSDPSSFGAGRSAGEALLASMTMNDPVLLLAAASSLESLATTSYELGMARAYRERAADCVPSCRQCGVDLDDAVARYGPLCGACCNVNQARVTGVRR